MIAFWRGVAFSARSAALSAQTIAFSRIRSARSNSSARKLSPNRITRIPGPGTPGPDITIPASTSSTPMITTPIRRTIPASSWRFLRSCSLRSRSGHVLGVRTGVGPEVVVLFLCGALGHAGRIVAYAGLASPGADREQDARDQDDQAHPHEARRSRSG